MRSIIKVLIITLSLIILPTFSEVNFASEADTEMNVIILESDKCDSTSEPTPPNSLIVCSKKEIIGGKLPKTGDVSENLLLILAGLSLFLLGVLGFKQIIFDSSLKEEDFDEI